MGRGCGGFQEGAVALLAELGKMAVSSLAGCKLSKTGRRLRKTMD
jgi:hypothetical protein